MINFVVFFGNLYTTWLIPFIIGVMQVVRVNIDVNEDAVDEANVLALPAVHFWYKGLQVGALTGKSTGARVEEMLTNNLQKITEQVRVQTVPLPPIITEFGRISGADSGFMEVVQ